MERGLNECDFGEWTGKKLSVLAKKPAWTTVQRAPSTFRFPGGESFVEMQSRMWATVSTLVARHPGQTIILVSHADPIKAVLTYAQGVPLDLFQRTVISPCSLSAVVLGHDMPIVLCVNATGSLSELRPS